MRAHKKQLIEWILLVVFWLSVIPGWSQEKTPFAEENTYITVSGVVKDKQNRRTLEYVNVSVSGSSVGTVTNADGDRGMRRIFLSGHRLHRGRLPLCKRGRAYGYGTVSRSGTSGGQGGLCRPDAGAGA